LWKDYITNLSWVEAQLFEITATIANSSLALGTPQMNQ